MLIHVEPVRGDRTLRLEQIHAAFAHAIVQVILNLVLLVETGSGFGCFGPYIRNIVAATQFKWDKVLSEAEMIVPLT
jgi:hypothetical protein